MGSRPVLLGAVAAQSRLWGKGNLLGAVAFSFLYFFTRNIKRKRSFAASFLHHRMRLVVKGRASRGREHLLLNYKNKKERAEQEKGGKPVSQTEKGEGGLNEVLLGLMCRLACPHEKKQGAGRMESTSR